MDGWVEVLSEERNEGLGGTSLGFREDRVRGMVLR